ncbi:hypothetical protein [Gorillibacterium sp. CAU 1737]|uniref:DUF7716 domain-containing protein n=1 Tax=Gorillibacterium sp. CAU 1737 TaxID=3140362 RepID=UPI003261CF13
MDVIRKPITIHQLIGIAQDDLDEFNLYRKEDSPIDETSTLYLDDPIDVDDETDEEIYPEFAKEHGLSIYFSGQVASDLIANTRHQVKNPSLQDYIDNFNYYDKHDCFFTFSQ